jgi:hypothetical protein
VRWLSHCTALALCPLIQLALHTPILGCFIFGMRLVNDLANSTLASRRLDCATTPCCACTASLKRAMKV